MGKKAMSTVTRTRAPNVGPTTRTMIGVSTMIGVTCSTMSHGHKADSSARDMFMTTPNNMPMTVEISKPTSAVPAEMKVAETIRSTVASLTPTKS